MPQTTLQDNTPRKHHGSEHWLPLRVARRLVHKHGFPEARRREPRQKALHAKALNHGVRSANTPFLIIYWDIIAVAVARIPEPVRFQIARTAA